MCRSAPAGGRGTSGPCSPTSSRSAPTARAGASPVETWDNATLLCETIDAAGGEPFPWTIRLQRIAPGEKNTWYVEVKGTKGCARFSTKNPKLLETLHYAGGEQSWQQTDIGHEPAFPTITGRIFEFGFSDACLQMLAGLHLRGGPWAAAAASRRLPDARGYRAEPSAVHGGARIAAAAGRGRRLMSKRTGK